MLEVVSKQGELDLRFTIENIVVVFQMRISNGNDPAVCLCICVAHHLGLVHHMRADWTTKPNHPGAIVAINTSHGRVRD